MLLVTGITGHTGKFFLQELISNKYSEPIRCVIRENSDTTLLDNSTLNIEKVIGNLDDTDFIDRAMHGVDIVMHIYNIHHSPVIVENAIKHGVQRVILVHTTGIYSKFKYASEGYREIEDRINKLINQSTSLTKITILRPSMIYGDLCDKNMSKFIRIIDKIRIIPVIDGGHSLIQPVNARDLGKAYYKVLVSPKETDGKTYDLSGDKPIRLIDVFRIISMELNKKTVFVSIPLGLGVLLAKILKLFTIGKIDFVEKVQRMGEDRSYSHEKASYDFEYTPMTFENGIKIEVSEYKKKTRRLYNGH